MAGALNPWITWSEFRQSFLAVLRGSATGSMLGILRRRDPLVLPLPITRHVTFEIDFHFAPSSGGVDRVRCDFASPAHRSNHWPSLMLFALITGPQRSSSASSSERNSWDELTGV